MYQASRYYGRLPERSPPSIQFLFVGTCFCRQLLSDPGSPQAPLPQLVVPLSTVHAGLSPVTTITCLAHIKRASGNPEALFLM
jgi:hypothetical protein